MSALIQILCGTIVIYLVMYLVIPIVKTNPESQGPITVLGIIILYIGWYLFQIQLNASTGS